MKAMLFTNICYGVNILFFYVLFLSILEAQSIVSLNDDLNLASKTKEKKLIVFLKILAIEKW
jgi:hypothetical protein